MMTLDSILLETMTNEDITEILSENYNFIDMFLEESDMCQPIEEDDDDEDDYPEYISAPYYQPRGEGENNFPANRLVKDHSPVDRLEDIRNTEFAYEDYDDEDDEDDDDYDENERDNYMIDTVYGESAEECGPSIDLMVDEVSLAGYDYILDDEVDEYLAAIDDLETLRGMEAEDLIIGSPAEDLNPGNACTLYPCGVDSSFDMYCEC